jgi:hypothetical protein
MKGLAVILVTLSMLGTVAGCATTSSESPAASPDFSDRRTVPEATSRGQSP